MTETLYRSSDRGLERWAPGGWTLADFIDCGDGNHYEMNSASYNAGWAWGFACGILVCMGVVAGWAIYVSGGH